MDKILFFNKIGIARPFISIAVGIYILMPSHLPEAKAFTVSSSPSNVYYMDELNIEANPEVGKIQEYQDFIKNLQEVKRPVQIIIGATGAVLTRTPVLPLAITGAVCTIVACYVVEDFTNETIKQVQKRIETLEGTLAQEQAKYIPRENLIKTPEPLTILGSITALGFGGFLKRKLGKHQTD